MPRGENPPDGARRGGDGYVPTATDGPPPTVLALPSGHVLRPWRPDDVDAVLAVFQDPDVVRWDFQLPMTDRGRARSWLDQREARWRDGSRASWAVADASGQVVGSFGLAHLDLASRPFPPAHATVSYMLLPAGRGRGLATRGVAVVGDWLLEHRGLHRVELRHDVANAASCAVARRCGFELEGTLRQAQRTAAGWTDEHLHARILATAPA